MIDTDLINQALSSGIPKMRPTYKQPCVQCGECCCTLVCKIGQVVYDITAQEAPCPGLVWKDGNYLCAFVIAEAVIIRQPEDRRIAQALGIGQGCGNMKKRKDEDKTNADK